MRLQSGAIWNEQATFVGANRKWRGPQSRLVYTEMRHAKRNVLLQQHPSITAWSRMGFSYRYDARTNTLFVRGSGVLTSEEFVAGVTRLRADTGKVFPFDCRRFGDYGAVDVFDISQAVLDQLFGPTWRPPPGRHAILMFSPLGASAFEKFLQRLLDNNCHFFVDRQLALDWLNEGVPAEMAVTSSESRS